MSMTIKVSIRNVYQKLILITLSSICLLVLFTKFASNGPDWQNYRLDYAAALFCGGCKVEGQSILASKVYFMFGTFGFEFAIFLYLISLMVLILKMLAARSIVGSGWLISFFLYASSVFWLQDLIQFKLSMAFAFLLLSLNALFLEKNTYWSLILVGIALLLHSSIIFFVITYFAFSIIKLYRNNKTFITLIFAAVVIVVVKNIFIAQEQFFSYIVNAENNRIIDYLYDLTLNNHENRANLLNVHVMYSALISLLYLFVRKNLFPNEKNIKDYCDFLIFSTFCAILFKGIFLTVPVMAFRVFELLVAPLFIVQAIIVTWRSRISIYFRVFLFFIFIVLNSYVYIFKNPIFY